MYDDMKNRCTGAGSELKNNAQSIKKLALISAIAIVVIGLIAAMSAGNTSAIVNYVIGAFVDLVVLYIFALVLNAIADITINTEIAARVACDEHDNKEMAKKTYMVKSDVETVITNVIAQEPAEAVSEPAPSQAPVANNAFKPIDPAPEKKPIAKAAAPAPARTSTPAASAPKKEAAPAPSVRKEAAPSRDNKSESKLGGGLSSRNSGSADKLPVKDEEESEVVAPTTSITFTPFPAAPAKEEAASPFKPMNGNAKSASSKPAEQKKEPKAASPFTPFPAAPAPAKEETTSPFKPLVAKPAKEEVKEEPVKKAPAFRKAVTEPTPSSAFAKPAAKPASKPAANNAAPAASTTSTGSAFAKPATKSLAEEEGLEVPAGLKSAAGFTPFKAPEAEDSNPFKPAAPVASEDEIEESKPLKINKLHKCPKCEVMISSNPCPRCGYEITAEDMGTKTEPSEDAKPNTPKSGINKLHKCSNCGRIAKQSPCEHCGAQ